MEKFHSLYEQYSILKDKLKENQDDFTTDLSKYGMTEDYYKRLIKPQNNFASSILSNLKTPAFIMHWHIC